MAEEKRESQARSIHIKGASEHNLKNIEVRLPRDQLVVITGVSGSGKSSLAFDTLYAEGYRKYMDSLSVRTRQLLAQVQRPDVDFIHGLSPVIAIEQLASAGVGPRSTLATATEVADYARLLWSILGKQYCPVDGGEIVQRSLDDCVDRIFEEPAGSRVILLAPYLQQAKTALVREELPRLQQRGFHRVRINQQVLLLGDPEYELPRGEALTVELVIDRIILNQEQRGRVTDSLELAFQEGGNRAIVLVQEKKEGTWRQFTVSQTLCCVSCGATYEPLTPRHFSHNHPEGACGLCGGVGETLQFQEELIVDPKKSIKQGAIKPWRLGSKAMIIKRNALLKQLAEQLPFDPNTPWEALPRTVQQVILCGGGERQFSFKLKPGNYKPEPMPFLGVLRDLEQTFRETSSRGLQARLVAYQTRSLCVSCHGGRLSKRSAAVLLAGASIVDFFRMTVVEAHRLVCALRAAGQQYAHVTEALVGLEQRLHFLCQVGLDYLTLDRGYSTLSGGEAQRTRLATQLGMELMGVIYVLDEPSIGLHPHDHGKLLATLLELRNRGNSVIVVEHDAATMLAADYLVELGPAAGVHGGEVKFVGTPEACMADERSTTGPFLSGKMQLQKEADTLPPERGWLRVLGAAEHNLSGIDVAFPVGLLTGVCGVSGSGKSTLVNDILGQAAALMLNRAKAIPGKHRGVEGLDHFDKVIRVDQSPIGRSPRSNPATYTKLFDLLRDLFSRCPLAKVRGYKASRFSFNIRGGRCEKCQGDGAIKLDMQFMGDVYVECPSCYGSRYNRETLEIRYKGLNIAEVLALTVVEALTLFRHQPKIFDKLQTLNAVGLGYLQLGQAANTLSGGEAQRLKLSLELSKKSQGNTLYLLDEPTTGLHWEDIQQLMTLLWQLRDAGNTLIIIEHHLDVLKMADWLIELGPAGGSDGGELVYAGPSEGITAEARSLTGQCLRDYCKQRASGG